MKGSGLRGATPPITVSAVVPGVPWGYGCIPGAPAVTAPQILPVASVTDVGGHSTRFGKVLLSAFHIKWVIFPNPTTPTQHRPQEWEQNDFNPFDEPTLLGGQVGEEKPCSSGGSYFRHN